MTTFEVPKYSMFLVKKLIWTLLSTHVDKFLHCEPTLLQSQIKLINVLVIRPDIIKFLETILI